MQSGTEKEQFELWHGQEDLIACEVKMTAQGWRRGAESCNGRDALGVAQ